MSINLNWLGREHNRTFRADWRLSPITEKISVCKPGGNLHFVLAYAYIYTQLSKEKILKRDPFTFRQNSSRAQGLKVTQGLSGPLMGHEVSLTFAPREVKFGDIGSLQSTPCSLNLWTEQLGARKIIISISVWSHCYWLQRSVTYSGTARGTLTSRFSFSQLFPLTSFSSSPLCNDSIYWSVHTFQYYTHTHPHTNYTHTLACI